MFPGAIGKGKLADTMMSMDNSIQRIKETHIQCIPLIKQQLKLMHRFFSPLIFSHEKTSRFSSAIVTVKLNKTCIIVC